MVSQVITLLMSVPDCSADDDEADELAAISVVVILVSNCAPVVVSSVALENTVGTGVGVVSDEAATEALVSLASEVSLLGLSANCD